MDTNIALRILEENRDFDGAVDLVDIEGMSSPRVCNFLNRLVSAMDLEESYLEVGTWKGRTLVSAAWGNIGRVCFGCDRFRTWGRYTGPGFLARRALYDNLARYRGRTAEIRFFRTTSEQLFRERLVDGPIGVYFYDGDHSYAGTRHGVMAAAPLLSQRSVLLMDDWNDPVIRGATLAGIADAGLETLWHRALDGNHSESGWWNGLGVFYLENHLARHCHVARAERGPEQAFSERH